VHKAVVAWFETTIPPCDSPEWVLLESTLHLLDDAQRDTLKRVYQALGVPMERMSYHVVDFLVQGSGALFRWER
jgi:hypothetical protein